MPSRETDMPNYVPVLSRGKHRRPRSGACFMEMASFLAGERWSDHPRCTHPLLAGLARLVNDYTSDASRSELAELIPSVIGLTSEDLRVDARIALRCAQVALPVASAERQRIMAVSILTANRVLTDLDDCPPGSLDDQSRTALQQAPEAARWADRFTGKAGISTSGFRRRTAPAIVRSAVRGIAEACILAPDQLLREVLAETICDIAASREHAPHAAGPDAADLADRMPWQGVRRRHPAVGPRTPGPLKSSRI
jgi:hypothetical protein